MNQRRYDWLSDRWIVYAPLRAARPNEFQPVCDVATSHSSECPFCAGNEHLTPRELLSIDSVEMRRKSSGSHPRWQVRVVSNKYPAVGSGADLVAVPAPKYEWMSSAISELDGSDSRYASVATVRKLRKRSAVDAEASSVSGGHEVIIETPEHRQRWSSFTTAELTMVFQAYQKRLTYWRANAEVRHATVFKNEGRDAGASLSHPHSQLIATDFLPPSVERTCQRLEDYLRTHRVHYWEDLIERELESEARIVADSTNFIAVTPFASPFAYAVSILPKSRKSRFEETAAELLYEFAEVVRQVSGALDRCLPGVAYNAVIRTAPFEAGWEHVFHWWMEICPRLTRAAGFELGTDCYINSVLPEVAAEELRSFAESA